ncbi:MAG: Rossmann-like and DUF2520 domain-containing protein [Desulfobacterales bacterium]
MEKPNFTIVGCGRLGTALGKHLSMAGYPLKGLTGGSLRSIQETARIIGTDKIYEVPWEISRTSDVVFITTPDGVITRACRTLAENNGFKEGAIVLHCSGAHPSTILQPAQKAKAMIGSMHPLQSFASKTTAGNPFAGIIISVEGVDTAVNVARRMADDLGAKCLTIPTASKTLYHASAVVASNYLVTLLELAFKLIGTAGISPDEAFGVLKPLVDGTLANIRKTGIPEALTGPIARGDMETVGRHVTEIMEKIPETAPLYGLLGIYTINIALEKGTLNKDAAKALQKVLKEAVNTMPPGP